MASTSSSTRTKIKKTSSQQLFASWKKNLEKRRGERYQDPALKPAIEAIKANSQDSDLKSGMVDRYGEISELLKKRQREVVNPYLPEIMNYVANGTLQNGHTLASLKQEIEHKLDNLKFAVQSKYEKFQQFRSVTWFCGSNNELLKESHINALTEAQKRDKATIISKRLVSDYTDEELTLLSLAKGRYEKAQEFCKVTKGPNSDPKKIATLLYIYTGDEKYLTDLKGLKGEQVEGDQLQKIKTFWSFAQKHYKQNPEDSIAKKLQSLIEVGCSSYDTKNAIDKSDDVKAMYERHCKWVVRFAMVWGGQSIKLSSSKKHYVFSGIYVWPEENEHREFASEEAFFKALEEKYCQKGEEKSTAVFSPTDDNAHVQPIQMPSRRQTVNKGSFNAKEVHSKNKEKEKEKKEEEEFWVRMRIPPINDSVNDPESEVSLEEVGEKRRASSGPETGHQPQLPKRMKSHNGNESSAETELFEVSSNKLTQRSTSPSQVASLDQQSDDVQNQEPHFNPDIFFSEKAMGDGGNYRHS